MERAELIRLFAGDPAGMDWSPYPHPQLARAICEAYGPSNVEELRCLVYGNTPWHDIGTDAAVALREGFRLWRVKVRRDNRAKRATAA